MLTILDMPKHHWNYFLALEKELDNLTYHIEFCNDNFTTYSTSLAKIILTSCAEIDVLCKSVCRLKGKLKDENMNSYRTQLDTILPQLKSEHIYINRYQIKTTPWGNFNKDINPDWWTQHQKIKHERIDNFKFACLKNAINSLGGLLILLTYYYFLEEADTNKNVKISDVINKLQPFPTLVTLESNYYPTFITT